MQQSPKNQSVNQPSEAEIRLSYETAVYREQLKLLQGEVERVTLTTLDLENAVKTLENLKAEDAIVPVGGGTFIKANIYSTHAIVPVGAGYFVEMGREQGILEMKKRVESTKKAIDRLREEFEKISKKLQEMNMNLRNMRAASAINKRVEENEQVDYI